MSMMEPFFTTLKRGASTLRPVALFWVEALAFRPADRLRCSELASATAAAKAPILSGAHIHHAKA